MASFDYVGYFISDGSILLPAHLMKSISLKGPKRGSLGGAIPFLVQNDQKTEVNPCDETSAFPVTVVHQTSPTEADKDSPN